MGDERQLDVGMGGGKLLQRRGKQRGRVGERHVVGIGEDAAGEASAADGDHHGRVTQRRRVEAVNEDHHRQLRSGGGGLFPALVELQAVTGGVFVAEEPLANPGLGGVVGDVTDDSEGAEGSAHERTVVEILGEGRRRGNQDGTEAQQS
jgi:hypothetical protein